jgi:carbon-monoxide dehydrogenase medium subunit
VRRFELLEPGSLEEAAVQLADRPDARPIAGGTAMLILIKQGLYQPVCLVNLARAEGARGIVWDPGTGLRIGALTTIHDVGASPDVRAHYPLLASACSVVANIRIRHLATLGGNLAHADHQSDPPAALLALDAEVELLAAGGGRRVPLGEFLLGSYETALGPGELVSAIRVPAPAQPGGTGADRNVITRSRYLKFTSRSAGDRPCASIAVLLRASADRCEDLRLVVGAVSTVPVRVRDGEAIAAGRPLTTERIEAIGEAAAAAVDPVEDIRGPADYKRRVVSVLTRRVLASLAAPAGAGAAAHAATGAA